MVKKVLLALPLTCSLFSVEAQTNEERKAELDSSFISNKNEIGVFGQGSFGYPSFNGEGMAGLQFKRWLKPNVALRFSGGINPYSYMRFPRIGSSTGNDSVRVHYVNNKVNRYFASIGIETQRHFYKRVYLFAGLDLVGAYGVGTHTNYSRVVPVQTANQYYITNFGEDYKEERFRSSYLSLVPTIGVKLVHKKITYGIEANFAQLGISSEKLGNNKAYASPTFNAFDNFNLRFFMTYRLGKK